MIASSKALTEEAISPSGVVPLRYGDTLAPPWIKGVSTVDFFFSKNPVPIIPPNLWGVHERRSIPRKSKGILPIAWVASYKKWQFGCSFNMSIISRYGCKNPVSLSTRLRHSKIVLSVSFFFKSPKSISPFSLVEIISTLAPFSLRYPKAALTEECSNSLARMCSPYPA